MYHSNGWEHPPYGISFMVFQLATLQESDLFGCFWQLCSPLRRRQLNWTMQSMSRLRTPAASNAEGTNAHTTHRGGFWAQAYFCRMGNMVPRDVHRCTKTTLRLGVINELCRRSKLAVLVSGFNPKVNPRERLTWPIFGYCLAAQ